MLIMIGTRKLLEAHEKVDREQFNELRAEGKERELRIQNTIKDVGDRFAADQMAHHLDNHRRFDKLEGQVSSLTTKLAGLIAGIALLGWVVEHFHLLARL